MRVGIVTPRAPPNYAGGGEISVRLLAEGLATADRVEDVVVFSFDGTGVERRGGVEYRRLGDVSSTVTEWQNLRAYGLLREEVGAFDVLHAHNMELHPTIGALSGSTGTVAVFNSYHFLPRAASNTDSRGLERLYEVVGRPTTGRILRHYIERVDAFVAISDAVRRVYADYGYDPERFEVVPEMIDPSFSVPEVEPAADDRVTVLYVGRLVPIKGVDELVRAIEVLPADYELRIVGDGPIADDLEEMAESLGVDDRITFVGHVEYETIPAQYAKADVFVHPGRLAEPFGRTILEAMQAGLPVVCSDIGGPADVVRDPELRYEPSDVDALAATIRRASRSGAELGDCNRRYVTDEFSPESVVSQFVDLYERVRT